MVKNKKLMLKLMVCILIFAIFQTPLYYVFAQEDYHNSLNDISNWAVDEVNMAYLYGLAPEEMRSNFKRGITNEELVSIGLNLYGVLSDNLENEDALYKYYNKMIDGLWEGEYSKSRLSTRGEVIRILYSVIKDSTFELKLSEDLSLAEKYLIKANILKGRGNNKIDLESYCNRQELFALVKRTYEFVTRETGKASKGYFYKLYGGKSEVYILGSIHMADISIYPLDQRIEDAYNKADYIAVEADITNMSDSRDYIYQKALFSDGTTINEVLTPETYEMYKSQMEFYGFGIEIYNILKPWYAAMLIQNLNLQESSYEAGLGIDMHFLSRTIDKEILEIEGVKFQIDLFDNFSKEIQEMFLLDALLSTGRDNEEDSLSSETLAYMLKVWSEGNEEELIKLISIDDETEVREFDQIFWVERNKNMTQKIISYSNDDRGKTYFVIVGAGHLVGDSGVVKELLDLGYLLERVN